MDLASVTLMYKTGISALRYNLEHGLKLFPVEWQHLELNAKRMSVITAFSLGAFYFM